MRYLDKGEEVCFEARPHGVALARPLLQPLILAGAGGIVVWLGSPYGWGLAAVGALALLAASLLALREVWRWDRTKLVLTTEKLFVVHGVARRQAAAVRLGRVPEIEVEQSLPGRLLGYGTIIAGNLEIPYVAEPDRLYRLLR